MKLTAVTLIFLCKGLFTFDGEECQKWVVTDNKQFKIVYVLDESIFKPTDTINVQDSIWQSAKDTFVPLTHSDSIVLRKSVEISDSLELDEETGLTPTQLKTKIDSLINK